MGWMHLCPQGLVQKLPSRSHLVKADLILILSVARWFGAALFLPSTRTTAPTDTLAISTH